MADKAPPWRIEHGRNEAGKRTVTVVIGVPGPQRKIKARSQREANAKISVLRTMDYGAAKFEARRQLAAKVQQDSVRSKGDETRAKTADDALESAKAWLNDRQCKYLKVESLAVALGEHLGSEGNREAARQKGYRYLQKLGGRPAYAHLINRDLA